MRNKKRKQTREQDLTKGRKQNGNKSVTIKTFAPLFRLHWSAITSSVKVWLDDESVEWDKSLSRIKRIVYQLHKVLFPFAIQRKATKAVERERKRVRRVLERLWMMSGCFEIQNKKKAFTKGFCENLA